MPGGNGTGPAGMGPMTGRGAGYCAGYSTPGYANPIGGRGFGFGRGGRGRGFGWARGGYGAPVFGVAPYNPAAFNQAVDPKQQVDALKNQAKYLENSLNEIKNQIAELESTK